MRIKGTNYEIIDSLPEGSKPVSLFARKKGWAVGYIYIKYKRFIEGYKGANGTILYGENPGYQIRCFEGTNYVIPE